MTKKFIFGEQKGLYRSGYSLVELLVVISIILTILFVVLFKYPLFSDQKTLQLYAQDISLTAREAQQYSLAGKENSENQFVNFGIFYTTTTQKITFFADANNDGIYSSSPVDTILKEILVSPPISIQSVKDDTLADVSEFTVLYSRTSQEPEIKVKRGNPSIFEVDNVNITLVGPTGTTAVEIWNSGLIVIK